MKKFIGKRGLCLYRVKDVCFLEINFCALFARGGHDNNRLGSQINPLSVNRPTPLTFPLNA